MAKRPVFIALNTFPYYKQEEIEFEYFNGFAISQKQKSIKSLHRSILEKNKELRILEISTKSEEEIGFRLSAFNLKFKSKEYNGEYNLENIFQSSKVFENGGPYRGLLNVPPKDAKRDDRLLYSGKLIAFDYAGHKWELTPKTMFYDWIYMTALSQNEELSELIMNYDAFTDIEFNPERSINCQARSAAIFVGLTKAGILKDIIQNCDSMKSIYAQENESVQISLF